MIVESSRLEIKELGDFENLRVLPINLFQEYHINRMGKVQGWLSASQV
jgi:hypothetical protein